MVFIIQMAMSFFYRCFFFINDLSFFFGTNAFLIMLAKRLNVLPTSLLPTQQVTLLKALLNIRCNKFEYIYSNYVTVNVIADI